MITCSACGEEFAKEENAKNVSDIGFDFFYPACGAGVIEGGNAEEVRRQQEVQTVVISQIQELAEETQTPGYEGPQHSIEQLRHRLRQILNEIDSELERREN